MNVTIHYSKLLFTKNNLRGAQIHNIITPVNFSLDLYLIRCHQRKVFPIAVISITAVQQCMVMTFIGEE